MYRYQSKAEYFIGKVYKIKWLGTIFGGLNEK